MVPLEVCVIPPGTTGMLPSSADKWTSLHWVINVSLIVGVAYSAELYAFLHWAITVRVALEVCILCLTKSPSSIERDMLFSPS